MLRAHSNATELRSARDDVLGRTESPCRPKSALRSFVRPQRHNRVACQLPLRRQCPGTWHPLHTVISSLLRHSGGTHSLATIRTLKKSSVRTAHGILGFSFTATRLSHRSLASAPPHGTSGTSWREIARDEVSTSSMSMGKNGMIYHPKPRPSIPPRNECSMGSCCCCTVSCRFRLVW